MTTTMQSMREAKQDHWIEPARQRVDAAGEGPSFLADLRRKGLETFQAIGFPTTRDEEWKHTNVAPIVRTRYERPDGRAEVSLEQLGPFSYADCTQLVFVDGRFSEELSTLLDLPEGVIVEPMSTALTEHTDLVEEHLGRYADISELAFSALNTARFDEGSFIYVPKSEIVTAPIHILYVFTEQETPQVSWPRNLFVMEENSQATLIESYAGLGRGGYLTVPVTELVAGDYAVIEHYKLQQESIEASHLAYWQLSMGTSTTVTSQNVSLGGGFVRNDIRTRLEGEGGDCTLDGLYLTKGEQFVDNHMLAEHIAPNCRSFELYKGILDGSSRAVFNGLIHVHQGAQKTDGVQSNRNLLLSKDALVNSNPQLLIFADDVKCTHGSTVGQLDRDALFYLRSRGIGEEAARSLLIYAFASEFVGKIQFEPVRKDLEEFLFTRLPKGEIVRQAV
ncbi:MAG: Fe-S cluster assembly protein SufD [bacterium]